MDSSNLRCENAFIPGEKNILLGSIQDQFSNFDDNPSEFVDLLKIEDSQSYNNYLFKVSDVSGKNQVQLTNLIYAKDLISENIDQSDYIKKAREFPDHPSKKSKKDNASKANDLMDKDKRSKKHKI